jgi:hypothetical protein
MTFYVPIRPLLFLQEKQVCTLATGTLSSSNFNDYDHYYVFWSRRKFGRAYEIQD